MSKKQKVPGWNPPFPEIKEGVPYEVSKVFYEECCDCGLVHKTKYEAFLDGKPIKGAEIRATCWRHESATKKARKLRKAQGL